MSKNVRKKREAIRRIERNSEKKSDKKESDLKNDPFGLVAKKTKLEAVEKIRLEAVERARKKPLSVLGNKAIREHDAQKKPCPTLGEFITTKEQKKGELLDLPTDKEKIKKILQSSRFKPTPRPTAYWLENEAMQGQ